MTEAEWLACTEPGPMLEFLRGKASDRKFRLLQVACCRRVWDLLPDDPCREAVQVAELFADGHATDRKRTAIRKEVARPGDAHDLTEVNARGAVFTANEKTIARRLCFVGVAAVLGHAASPTRESGSAAYKAAYQAEEEAEASLVRCVFGNPFRPVLPLPASLLEWHHRAVPGLAQAVYEDRLLPSGHLDAARLAVLADMLEEAGSTDAELLGHLRSAGPHVRGCFAVDAILQRE